MTTGVGEYPAGTLPDGGSRDPAHDLSINLQRAHDLDPECATQMGERR